MPLSIIAFCDFPKLGPYVWLLRTLKARLLIVAYSDPSFGLQNRFVIIVSFFLFFLQMLKDELKKKIIDLSIEFSIVTQFTSFVAIEEREVYK